MVRSCLALALLAAGCSFGVDGVGADDLATGQPGPDDGVADDLAQNGGADLSAIDLAASPSDFATAPPDLSMAMATATDLSPPPDLLPRPFVPSHVAAGDYLPNASDLVGVTQINTKQLQLALNGGALQNPPAGVTFVQEGSFAVLSVGAWTVNQALAVTGDSPLVVVAAKAVTITQAITAAGEHQRPGPGGGDGSSGKGGVGIGGGADGASNGALEDSGGAGAGFGTVGGAGGDSSMMNVGPSGGLAYGPAMSELNAGSGGGQGGRASQCNNNLRGLGGGGGGAIQISSAASITLSSSGSINVGGGGGRGGCPEVASAGGGGGSGGEIFLEAPTVTVQGKLAANGGGGGSGGSFVPFQAGNDGENGPLSGAQANGGGASGAGAAGGAGGAVSGAPAKGNPATDAGGGGGAAGRIWLRTRGAPATTSNMISPAYTSDTSL